MVPDLLALAATWPPDLSRARGAEYGGCLAAEVLGLPHAAVGINAVGDFVPREHSPRRWTRCAPPTACPPTPAWRCSTAT